MNPPKSKEPDLIYSIDENDRLCAVSAEWEQLALDTDGTAVLPERILGSSLWDFIEDTNVRELYRQMIHRVRSGHPAQFDYRCDAPEWRRLFRMKIRVMDNGKVEFLSQLRWEEKRQRVNIFDSHIPRSDQWVQVCGWCQKVALPNGNWVSVEEAVQEMSLLTAETLPKLTHGICSPCQSAMLAELTPTADQTPNKRGTTEAEQATKTPPSQPKN